MQLHLLAIHHFLGVDHVLDELRIGGLRRVVAQRHLGFLGLVLVGTLGLEQVTVIVDRNYSLSIGLLDGQHQDIVQAGSKALATGRIANDESLTVESAQCFGTMVETIGATGHERHHHAPSHEQSGRVLVLFQSFADVPQQGILREQRLYLSAPLPQLLAHLILGTGRFGLATPYQLDVAQA